MKKRRLLAWLLSGLPLLGSAQAQQLVELNTATRAQLESVPGIGPQLAERLLAARPFADWPDLLRRVKGLGRASALRLSAQGLRVNGEALAAASEPG
jgi:competence protein ComEA